MWLAAATPAAAAPSQLPPNINQSLRDAGRPLLAVVAADIDADGDIDLVATDGSLDLLVWVNDGTGQFTRKRPAPTRDGRTEAPGPGVGNREPFGNDYISGDPPSVDADVRCALAAPSVIAARTEPTRARGRDRAHSTPSPRGPPSGSVLN